MDKFLSFFGHVNIDVKIKVENVDIPGSQKAETVEELFGGTAGNFAMIAGKIDVPFDLYSAVSPTTHSRYLKYLEDNGIDTSNIHMEDESGPICYIITDRDKQRAFMHQGPMETWKASEGFDGRRYQFINLGTGPSAEYMKIAGNSRKESVVFDPGQELSYNYDDESTNFMVKKSSLIMLNEDEFSTMRERLEKYGGTPDSVSEKFIVTQGSKGVEFHRSGELIKFNILKARTIYDTVGAGDAFRAGLYFGLHNNFEIEDSIIFGIIVSSAAIQKPIPEFSMNADQLMDKYEKNRNVILK